MTKENFDCPHCGNTYLRFQSLGRHCERTHGEKICGVRDYRKLYGRRVRHHPRAKRCKRKFPKIRTVVNTASVGASLRARFPTMALVYAVEAERWRLRNEEQERRAEQEAANMLLERLSDWTTEYETWEMKYTALKSDIFFVPLYYKNTEKKSRRWLKDRSKELRGLKIMVHDYELGNLTQEDMLRLYVEEDFDGRMRLAFKCIRHFCHLKETIEFQVRNAQNYLII